MENLGDFLHLRHSCGVNKYVTIPGQAEKATLSKIRESTAKLHAMHTESEKETFWGVQ